MCVPLVHDDLGPQGRGSLACKGFGGFGLAASRAGGAVTTAGSYALRRSNSRARRTDPLLETNEGAEKIRAAGSEQRGHGMFACAAAATEQEISNTPQLRQR
jgi:hypothetical protein